MNRSMPGLPVHHQLPESTQTYVHWVGDAIQPSHPLSSPSPPALNLSSIRIFSGKSALCIRWPKYWSFTFNISPSKAHPGLISFRMDWLDLLAVQGTLQSLLQHHSSKASILRCSAFFTVQLSHPYITTGAGPHLFPNSIALWLSGQCQASHRQEIHGLSPSTIPWNVTQKKKLCLCLKFWIFLLKF